MIRITPCAQQSAVHFAATELTRYLQRMGNAAEICAQDGDITLLISPPPDAHFADDGYRIDIRGGRGEICGYNARSVLFGVYHYLKACGCAFLYPGKMGEIVPIALPVDLTIAERPASRYRCVSIEGACARENVLDMIDWLPKAGLNSYHFQLLDGYVFYERWHSHANNPHKQAEPVTDGQTAELITEAAAEVKKRDLLLQYMGHGWTTEPFGLSAKGWNREALDPPPETLQMLAMVAGRRQIWKQIPVDTNACYSNAEARSRIVATIVGFAQAHPETDLLHVWLADDINNFCECDDCGKLLPADWYVMMLNELDAALTRDGLEVHVVFLVYSELLWAPLRERLHNPSRFLLLFAPVSLDYTAPFGPPDSLPEMKPFALNNIALPESAAENVSYLNRWQEVFAGDSFVYVYHLLSCGWEKDISTLFLSKLMLADIQQFRSIGLRGVSSCQSQRCAFPTGLTQYAMARGLWDANADADRILDEYLTAAFGQSKALALEVLQGVERLFPPDWLQGNAPRVDPAAAVRFASVADFASALRPKLARACAQEPDEARAFQLRMLELLMLLLEQLGPLFAFIASGDKGRIIRDAWAAFLQTLFAHEDELQSVFDMEWFVRNFELFEIRGLRHFVNDAPPWEDEV